MKSTYKKVSFLFLFISFLEAKDLYLKDINTISKSFLGKEYKSDTLIGSANKKEKLIINLEQVDCFTYIDYVSAYSLSSNKNEFKEKLISLRYKNSIVSYLNRNHFFTDWIINNSYKNISSFFAKTKKTKKYLNKKENTVYLKALDIKKRELEYIPKENVNTLKYKNFKNGDLIGIYSPLEGLDVTHVGIAIIKKEKVYLRHASLKYKKVVDELLSTYIKNKKALIILRK